MHPSRSAGRRRSDIASHVFLEIVGEAEHAREFVAGLRIEIGVAAAGVDRAVSDAYIRQARGLVSANRDVAGDVGHVVVDAGVPFQLEHRRQIPKAPCRVADGVGPREGNGVAERARGHAGQGPRQAGADDAIGCHEGHRRLAAEHRRLEYIARDHKAKIAGGVDVQIQICVDGNVGRNPAEREFTRTRDVGAGGYGGVVVDIRQRPTRLLRRGREASKEAGDPEADAAFIGQRTMRKKRDRGRQDDCSNAKSASMC